MTGYRRILLKLSGQSLAGPGAYGIDLSTLEAVVDELRAVREDGHELGIVVGGGNVFRGFAGAARGMDRPVGDQLGMLATVMNCLALQSALEKAKVPAITLSALSMPQVCAPFTRRRALDELTAGRVVLLAAGTGHPYFTTDTAAALRAAEIQADVLLKATRIDGIYDRDPEKYPGAVHLPALTYDEVLARDLRVLDATAVALCRDNAIPVVVFDLHRPGNILNAAQGAPLGSILSATGERPGAIAPERSREEAKP